MFGILSRLRSLGAHQGVLSREDVIAAYRWLLGREPESEAAIAGYVRQRPSVLIERFATAPEFHRHWKTSPFYHFNGPLDAEGIIRTHENPGHGPKPGHLVNFLGVAMNVAFMPLMAGAAGQVEGLPIPANYHAEMAEFAAALRAVDLARDRFAMIELGCGWGCWMNNTGMAARRRGLAVRLIGVEGDEGHLGFAREALATNGFAPEEYALWRGIAGPDTGAALFPRQDQAGESWGLEAKFGLSPEARAELMATGRYDELPVLALGEIVGNEARIDLLHMDIQGGEADFARDCMPTLVEKVAYLVIGTHSREIEGRLMADLLAAGWVLEIERACDFVVTPSGPETVMDGIQGWRNPRLDTL
jgi:hypothetical protein